MQKDKVSVGHHYDLLVEEGNDPVYDPAPLQEYMDKWDGHAFIEKLMLTGVECVLEIGVGTGRLARKICGNCGSFVGIDISPKTIEKARDNLAEHKNVELICTDILEYENKHKFDVIYSSLTFMHIEDKQAVINEVAAPMKNEGRFVLSISNKSDSMIDYATRKVEIYPDNPDNTAMYIKKAGLKLTETINIEFATIFIANRFE